MNNLRISLTLAVCAILAVPPGWAQQAQKLLLKGRIEEVVRLDRLPNYIFDPNLNPRMDLRKTLGARIVATYPDYMLGRWKGDLKTTWSSTAPGIDVIPQCQVGNVGSVVFKFSRTADGIELAPTNMFFPETFRQYDEGLLDKQGWTNGDPDEIKRQWKENGGKIGIRPMLSIGPQDLNTATGKKITTYYVYNTAKELTRGTVEQDLVTKQIFNGAFECYRESVTRFTWYSQTRVYCDMAFAEYKEDGTYMRRILLSGWLTKA